MSAGGTDVSAGRSGVGAVAFRQVRAEWTKLRTVRRWTLTLLAAAVAMVVVSLLGASGGSVQHAGGPEAPPPTGPDGKVVRDAFRFVHQGLNGDGTITAHLASLKSLVPAGPQGTATEPWAKAGIMVKAGTKPGASYVALLSTAGHGVRLQNDFTHDKTVSADSSGASWLRLTRSGSRFTAYVSSDGTKWTKAGSVTARGIPADAQAGVFATSPPHTIMERHFGSLTVNDVPAHAVGTFDNVDVTGTHPGTWTGTTVGESPTNGLPGGGGPAQTGGNDAPDVKDGSSISAGTITVTGSGEIAPEPHGMDLVQKGLQGALVGMLVVVAVGALSMTSEFRHGLVRTTFTALPRRGGMLVAKGLVLGVTVFAVSAVALAVAFPMAESRIRSSGFKPPGFPSWSLSDPEVLRAIIGSALLVALVAVLAMAFGAVFRHSAAAIAVVLVIVLVPQILAPALPIGASRFLMSVTPAAGFAVQQSQPHYAFTADLCLPEDGCYPLSPWAGLAVPCLYVLVAMVLAWWLLRRRDA
ncbi:ABC transporter permease subunit [Actinomadura oligospora]|uniref:ABC transporter permease subunit n=1 Tax=Actinomadura oligospora TaxID=111804 RepID=UPI000479D315|nr:ABC transporter permease subunit [Actinomadura oligospora]